MESTIIITATYYENYNVNSKGFGEVPYWKRKGNHEFSIVMNSDLVFYCDDVDQIFTEMVSKHNTIAEKFEYVDYKIQHQQPTELGSVEDFLTINKSLNS